MKRHVLGKSMTVVGLLTLSPVASAQDSGAPANSQDAVESPAPQAITPPAPPPAGKDKVEKISVTGSRIKREDMTVSSPLTVIGREEIANTGAQTVTDIVKDLPAAIGNSVTTTTTNGGGGGSGNIALRGLDASSTLVLLNGRRLPADAGGSSPDLNSIPVAAIERVEVLQDGASAIYGSDAIAGVINIITRKDYEGFDFSTYYGQSSRGDLQTKTVDVTYGSVSDRANMVLGVSIYSQGNVAARDREVSRVTLAPSSATPNARVTPPGTPPAPVTVNEAFSGVKPTQADFRPVNGDDVFNYSAYTDAIMAQDRKSLFVSGGYEFKPGLKGFVESTFATTESRYNSAPSPLFLSQETGDLSIDAANEYNPYNVALKDVRKRFVEFGPRVNESVSNTFRVVAGLEGEFNEKWNWDLAYNHGQASIASRIDNIMNKSNLMLGIGAPSACGTLATIGCVPVNILGPTGSLDAAQIDWLRASANDLTRTDVDSYIFNTSGELAQTSLGTISLAGGVEIRQENYSFDADSNSQKYNTIGSTNGKSTEGDRDVKEAYVELSVPLGKYVESEFAARYSDYSDFGTTTNPKVGLKFFPVEGLILRGTYSTGFRAPSLIELYQGQTENFATLSDPCQVPGTPGCVADADPNINQFLALVGGNPDLKPEKSKAFTFGVAYSYGFAFNAKADYFEVKTENAIDTNPQFVLDQFRESGRFADRVVVDANNNVKRLDAIALNLAARKVRGVDLGADYTLTSQAAGRYVFSVLGSHYIEYLNQADASAPFENVVGKFVDSGSGGRGSIPKWKGVAGVDWSRQQLNAGVNANYVSRLSTDSVDFPELAAWTTWDLRVGYNLDGYGDLSVGVNNVFDKEPPRTDAAFNDNIDARTHNLIGRFYYARYGVKL